MSNQQVSKTLILHQEMDRQQFLFKPADVITKLLLQFYHILPVNAI